MSVYYIPSSPPCLQLYSTLSLSSVYLAPSPCHSVFFSHPLSLLVSLLCSYVTFSLFLAYLSPSLFVSLPLCLGCSLSLSLFTSLLFLLFLFVYVSLFLSLSAFSFFLSLFLSLYVHLLSLPFFLSLSVSVSSSPLLAKCPPLQIYTYSYTNNLSYLASGPYTTSFIVTSFVKVNVVYTISSH